MNEYYQIYAWGECPYCVKVKDILIKNEKQFMFSCLDDSPELLKMIKERYNWETVPMILHFKREGKDSWVSEFVGGCSDLVKAFGDV